MGPRPISKFANELKQTEIMMRFLSRVTVTVGSMVLAVVATTTPAQENTLTAMTEESRKVALQVSQDLKTQLLREMKLSGPLRSLLVCKYSCPEILSAQSRRTGWKVAAVSLKPRNSALGMPDAWEQKVLLDLSKRAVNGEKADALEFTEVVNEPQGRYFRYARAMMVEPLCMPCHSSRDKMKGSVKEQLAIDYPFDKAVDFRTGEVYGIASIKRSF